MATITASLAQSNVVPRIFHGGTTTVVCSYGNAGETIPGSSVIKFMKVPHGAIIVDGWANFHHNGQAWLARVGLISPHIGTGFTNRFLNSATASDVVRFNGLPYRVSITSGEANQFVWVISQASGQVLSTTFSLTMMVQYVMD